MARIGNLRRRSFRLPRSKPVVESVNEAPVAEAVAAARTFTGRASLIGSAKMDEVSANALVAARRLQTLEGIPLVEVTREAIQLARRFIETGRIPEKFAENALHISLATVHGMDFLLTWNCRHIANGEIMNHLAGVAAAGGYELPVLCPPEQLMGD